MIPPDVRTKMLMENGYDFEKIVRATEQTLKIQEQRRESLKQTSWEGVKSFFGPAGKTLKLASTAAMPLLNRTGAKSA
jgi:hypothetical protein